MAEGGHLPEHKPGNGKTTTSPSRLLDCPICLEQMLQPKSLPCLHSFCEGCLSTYIVTDLSGEMATATSFPCPVCMTITSPVDPSESKESWARQFSSNDLVQDVNVTEAMADIRPFCGLCKKTKNIETPASYLCKPDGTLFCNSCKTNAHDFFHEICDIVTIDGTTQKKPLSKICATHNEKMEWYCKDHRMIRCNKCIITEHRRCDAVTTVKEFCEKQTEHSSLYEMKESLGMAVKSLELMVKACDDRDKCLEQNQEVGSKSISDLRQRINAYLDKKQEDITQELISKHKAEKEKVNVIRQKCSRLKTSIENTTEASSTAVRREDHVKTIQLFHRGQTELRSCNDLIDDISVSMSVTIKHDINSNLVTIDQTSQLFMGRILIEKQACNLPDGVEYLQNQDLLSNRCARRVKQCTIKIPSDQGKCDVRGVLLMPNGSMIISDFQNCKLKLFSFEGQCLNDLKIDGFPHDICLVDDVTVAVAVSCGQPGIHVVKVLDDVLTLSNVIKVQSFTQCYGITIKDGNWMISSNRNIYRIDKEGKAEHVDTLPGTIVHLASSPDRGHVFASVINSAVGNVSISKLSTNKQTCVLRVGVVVNAMGIDTDREGNLYVCGHKSNNVVQMSPNGTRIRELLTSKDGIDRPRAISVCGDRFLVSNQSSLNQEIVQIHSQNEMAEGGHLPEHKPGFCRV